MFEIGKIPPQILERIVLDPVTHSKVHRDDIVVRPKTGEDCSAMAVSCTHLTLPTNREV